jgi:hypothetical protein
MKLVEVLEIANAVLEGNLEEKVIIREPEIGDILEEILGLGASSLSLSNKKIISSKNVSIEILGIKFILERCKIKNEFTYTNIQVDENYSDKLLLEMEELKMEFTEIIKQRQELKKTKSLKNVDNFKKILSTYGITSDQFAEINYEFNELGWEEKRMLFGIE